MKKCFLYTSLLLLLTSCAGPSMQPNTLSTQRSPAGLIRSCLSLIKDFIDPHEKINFPLNKIIKQVNESDLIYPKDFEAKMGAHIQFGFESEYTTSEAEVFLKSYMPDSSMYNGSMEMWLGLTHEQRVEFLEENRKLLFPFRKKGKMIKISKIAELNSVLPDSFVFDAQHFEIVLDPMDSKEELFSKIKIINKYLGIGSMQVMISNPVNKFRLIKERAYQREFKKEILGYYNFINDLDTITKLNARYADYLAFPNDMALQSFNHPWLGPMTKLKQDRFKLILDGIVSQNPEVQSELDDFPTIVESSKFIGGVAFRPDIAYKDGRIASEIRDCHNDLNCLEEKTMREIYFLKKGRSSFAPFSELMPFDSIRDFNTKIPLSERNLLKSLFPAYQGNQEKELELFRNFAFPYRDWSKHLELLKREDLKEKIGMALNNYSFALRNISLDYQMKVISKEMAQVKVVGELTTFIYKSGLSPAMNAKLRELIEK